MQDDFQYYDTILSRKGVIYDLCNIYINNANPTISNCIIRSSHTYGIRCYGASDQTHPTITCNQITQNGYGVYSEQGAAPVTNNNNISGNTSYGVFNADSDVMVDATYSWVGKRLWALSLNHQSKRFRGCSERLRRLLSV